ncbi:MAG: adenylate kinase [Gammaproteobacteria bacterium]|nr:adenylate kinase [Gammaproteobacteria bacterium]
MNSRTEFEKWLSPIGTRIHVIGNSASGKSTLARRLALTLNANFVELDALNWLPNWVGLNETDPDELLRRFKNATQGDKFVVAGSYTRFAKQSFWPRLDTVIWLDLPVRVLIWRVIRRSWHRWRSKELLWGTNVERFWPHLALWRGEDSLIYWILSAQRGKRISMLEAMADPRWAGIRFIRLTSAREIERFTASIEAMRKN